MDPSSLLRPEPGERIRTPPIRVADEATSPGLTGTGGKGLLKAGADAQGAGWGAVCEGVAAEEKRQRDDQRTPLRMRVPALT